MDKTTHPYFVPNGDSRQETAVLLVGTAEEFGIDQRSVAAVQGGFRITEALMQALDEGSEYEDEDETLGDEFSGNPDSDDSDLDEDDLDEDDSEAPSPASDLYDPADHKVDQVRDFVTEHPDLAADILASEREGENRSTLVKWLSEFTDETSGDRAEKKHSTTGTDKE